MTFQQQGGCCSTMYEREKTFMESEKIYFQVTLKSIRGQGGMNDFKGYSTTELTVKRLSTNNAGNKDARILKTGEGNDYNDHLQELKPLYKELDSVAKCKKFIKKNEWVY